MGVGRWRHGEVTSPAAMAGRRMGNGDSHDAGAWGPIYRPRRLRGEASVHPGEVHLALGGRTALAGVKRRRRRHCRLGRASWHPVKWSRVRGVRSRGQLGVTRGQTGGAAETEAEFRRRRTDGVREERERDGQWHLCK